MYVAAANEVYALDARSGRQIWHYSRPLTKGVIGDAASGINRGVAVMGDRVFMATDNAHLIALDRVTGHLLWDAEMADFRQGIRCDIRAARGQRSGALRHFGRRRGRARICRGLQRGDRRARVAILDHARAGRAGLRDVDRKSHRARMRHRMADRHVRPVDGLVYWPTGNPCPDYNGDERKGDNLYSSSVVALEAKTGKLRWYFQFTPHDLHDWDAAETPMLLDAEFRGKPPKAAGAGQSQRIFLRTRSRYRRVSAGRAVRPQADVGERPRTRTDVRRFCRARSRARRERRSAPR